MTYKEILYYYWGYTTFRGIQEEIIESVSSGRDTLGLMPTGGGKSITFQVPALAREGVCVVVTPLIALMKDQVAQLRRRAILAAAIHSGMARDEIIRVLDNCILGNTKLLYISPERISSEIFLAKFRQMNVSLIVVDEAHCISQWGHDFRPSYLTISRLREIHPQAPILALTATATSRVADDIQESLQFREKNVLRMSFERKNLAYVVEDVIDKDAALVHLLTMIKGSKIVYTRSRRSTVEIAKMLEAHGMSTTFYHAGLNHAVRNQQQQRWTDDEVEIIVCTNAFGMGIDKADVRAVVHVDCPDSIEAYFQEAGRAGRDGAPAWAVMLHSSHDDNRLKRHIQQKYPPKSAIRDVYEHLAYYFQVAMGYGANKSFVFDLEQFCATYRFFPTTVSAALQLLEQAGYITYEDDPDSKARCKMLLRRDELYLLNDLAPLEERVITALLRTYGGLFADYVYINEALVAQGAGTDENSAYLALQVLSRKGVIHFIPQRKLPYITYTMDRVEKDDLVIPKMVYEDRIQQAMDHVTAILSYVHNTRDCRSRQLLKYFGEKTSRRHACGRCDVCLDKDKDATRRGVEGATTAILQLLGDLEAHQLREINNIPYAKTHISKALRLLSEEEKIIVEGTEIRLT